MTLIHLHHRVVATLSGPDRFSFLQGLVTCNVMTLEKGGAIYGAFLTSQGKFLDDLFLVAIDDVIYIDSYKDTAEALYKKLKMYKLRSDVVLTPLADARIYSSFEKPTDLHDTLIYQDTRHTDMGWRVIASAEPYPKANGDLKAYDLHRYHLGLPDGARDMPIDKAVLLEYGFDEMGAIDFEKGCYLGQELTARTKYRGVIRKRMLPFTYDGDTPAQDTEITYNDQKAGEVRAAKDGKGLALIRLTFLKAFLNDGGVFNCSETKIFPFVPSWMKIDFEESN